MMRLRASRSVLALGVAFALGIGAGAAGYKNISRWIEKSRRTKAGLGEYSRQAELLRGAFTDEIIAGPLLRQPCGDSSSVAEAIASAFSLPADAFFADANDIVVSKCGVHPIGKHQRLEVQYSLNAHACTAHAYGASSGKATKAVLVIPGSGMNESSKIVNRARGNYQSNILDLIGPEYDAYVLVKPNEDFLAIHNGKAKLDYQFIYNQALNGGGSYSSKYMCDAAALFKHLKTVYGKVYVAGLSQGGTAALYVALKCRPDGAIIASGWSVLGHELEPSGHNQIIVPGIKSRFAPADVRKMISSMPTRFLFTFGKAETGAYRVEANEGVTRAFFKDLPNVDVVSHDGGHVFPAEVGAFLSQDGRVE